ncbi:TPA: hypothetical protein CPT98_08610 [Candidatus Gastranaerophilales bacterium HUM_19]|jgi:putative periplasmic immunogenic protein|nr:MAG TPA: hypothetical protein CPT98_08610 [Candidatus Gastranaerophilales bacterium HUM_19]DAB16517.1 MAG TPA: hypothetical protein CPT97_06210 [Candidatus Gastranaerophilales bacterium HUM_17]
MKKTLLTAVVLGLIAVSAPLSTQAVTQVSHDRGYISVSTSANTEVAPDVAEISFAVQTSDTKSMQKATQLNKEASDRVLSVLSSMLNSSNGDYIKTSDFSASPIYTYSGSKRNLDKYEVSNRVIVHTKSLDKIGAMIDKAIEAGATNVDNLNFSLSTYDSQCNDLLGIATKKAQSRAGLLAKNLATTLDGVRTFDVSCNANNYSSPRMYMAKNMLASVADEAASGGTQTSISGGVVKIYANVNASFFVK